MQNRDLAKWSAITGKSKKGGTQLRLRVVAIIAFNVHCVMGVCGAGWMSQRSGSRRPQGLMA